MQPQTKGGIVQHWNTPDESCNHKQKAPKYHDEDALVSVLELALLGK